ncbi:hypothetical protein QYE76_053756 [Lolium multiflorum]|uniref:F-box domain-containing protein n=1 Tax=Lolium multiflorum TaxID=4521 RepID=A0AAD8SXF6_LOLMU|nr:hypothetical protein QYE76_053756 [Lolium multiflorum]
MSGDANAVAPARLLQEALENIMFRLPASDLRRFRRVCKEWRDVISDPIFIKGHLIQGPTAPTHTIVFVPSSKRSTNNNAFLFDERCQLTARFAVGASETMIGTCNGLLCFLDRLQFAIKIVEPFTGETITLPEPTYLLGWRFANSYCFGFDSTARQYKIVHQGVCAREHRDHLKVLTVGADEDWRTVSIARNNNNSNDLSCDGGAVYWSHREYTSMGPMYARFDLATEEVTSVKCKLVDGQPLFCKHPWWQRRGEPCAIRIKWLAGKSDDGYWPRDMDRMKAMAFHTEAISLPRGRLLPKPHALQRERLLLQEANGALYAHKIVSRDAHELEVGYEKLLVEIGNGVQEEPGKSPPSGQFVRVNTSPPSRRRPVATASGEVISSFAYVPTVSPAPLALYLGTRVNCAPAVCV